MTAAKRPVSIASHRHLIALAKREAEMRAGLEVWLSTTHTWHLFHPPPEAGRRALAEVGASVRATRAG